MENLDIYESAINKLYENSEYSSWASVKTEVIDCKIYIYFHYKNKINIRYMEDIHTNNVADVFFEFLEYEAVKKERRNKNNSVKDDIIKREYGDVKAITLIYKITIKEMDIIINSDKQYETIFDRENGLEIF
ncbi:hypothetical protein [Ferroplasma sp.]|uniref:hypothetical protein n=1 Tax=Ferroplasma sp. TaxID=2591003 RepID=UPI00307F8BB9